MENISDCVRIYSVICDYPLKIWHITDNTKFVFILFGKCKWLRQTSFAMALEFHTKIHNLLSSQPVQTYIEYG